MQILVTGGCGFIGSNLVPRLLDAGLRVRVLDDGSTGDPARLPDDVEFVDGDVRDAYAVDRAARGAELVVHLAARGSVPESIADPVTNFDVNARGTLNVLRAAQHHGAARVLLASTGGALMGDAAPPVDETTVPAPISPYGASKLAAEAYASAFAGCHGLSTAALRFGNVYGPHAERKRGAVTTFVANALAGRPLLIYGDGRATRDFIHVDDLCDGVVRALRTRSATGPFHLASGRETSVRELAELVRDATGGDAQIEYRPGRPGEVARNRARTERARLAFGFRTVVELEDGLRSTVDWFRARTALAVA